MITRIVGDKDAIINISLYKIEEIELEDFITYEVIKSILNLYSDIEYIGILGRKSFIKNNQYTNEVLYKFDEFGKINYFLNYFL